MIIGQVLFLSAIKVSKASLITPCIYSTIIFIVILDWIILQNNPGLWSILGTSLIIFAGEYTAFKIKED
jgi:drug/metabolite transporter (DMT)-like permease